MAYTWLQLKQDSKHNAVVMAWMWFQLLDGDRQVKQQLDSKA